MPARGDANGGGERGEANGGEERGGEERGGEEISRGILLLHPDTCLPMKEKGALEGMWAWAETFSQSLVQKIKLEEPDMHSRLVLVRKKKTEEVLQRRNGSARDNSSRAHGHRTVLRKKPQEEESMRSGNDAQRQDEQDDGSEEVNRTTEIRATAVNKPSESQMRVIRNSRNLDELNDWLSAVRERAGV